MQCPICASRIPDDARFCSYCSAPVIGSANTAPTQPIQSHNAYGSPQAQQGGTARQGRPVPPSTPAGNPFASGSTAPFYPVPAPAYATGQNVSAPARKHNVAVPIVVALLAVAAIAGTIYLFLNASGFSSVLPSSTTPQTAVEDAFDSLKRLDARGVLESFPAEVRTHMAQSSGFSSSEALVSQVELSFNEFKQHAMNFGIDPQSIVDFVDYRIVGTSHYSEDGLNGLRTHWNGLIDGFGDSIQDAAMVTVELKANASVDILGQQVPISDFLGPLERECVAAQVGGEWYLLEFDFSLPGF